MEQVRLAMRGKTLHLSCCCLQGPSFHQWGEVVKHLSTMTVYRTDLRTYVPDEAVMSSRRAAAVKIGAAIQRKKVDEAKISPITQNIYLIKLLQNDLQALHEEICLVTQSGIPWTSEYFGCNREELDEWRQYSLKLYQDLSEAKKR